MMTFEREFDINMEIIRIPERFMRANSYLIKTDIGYTLIDPGIAPAALNQTVGETVSDQVTQLVVTHPHYDHIVYMDHWQETYDLPVYIHEDATDILEDPDMNASVVFGRDVTFNSDCHLLREGATLPLDATHSLTAYHLPGHSVSDLVFALKKDGKTEPEAVFVGDVVFADSVGRTDLAGGNATDQQASLMRLARLFLLWPRDTVIYAGHGPLFTIGEALDSNVYMMAAVERLRRTTNSNA